MSHSCIGCRGEKSIAFEAVKKSEAHAKRWFTAWLITFITLLIIVGGIVYLVMTSETEIVTQDGSGTNNYIGNDGDVYNGSTNN